MNVNISGPPPPPAKEMDIPPMSDIVTAMASVAMVTETNNDGTNNYQKHTTTTIKIMILQPI